MHFSKSFISLCVFFLLSNAAPVERVGKSVISRELDDLDVVLERRGKKIKPADFQGAQYDQVPNHHIYKTETNSYTGAEVNAAAQNALHHAAQGTNSHPGYPKTGSGFPKTNPDDPSGQHHAGKVALHAPIINPTTDFSHSPPNHPNPPGPDRVVVWKSPNDPKFKAHVSYHDPKKPMTGAQTNHPFSAAKVHIPVSKPPKIAGSHKDRLKKAAKVTTKLKAQGRASSHKRPLKPVKAGPKGVRAKRNK